MRLVSISGFASALVLSFGLAGCATTPEEGEVLACPAVSILADAADATAFRPGRGRDIPDVHYQAHISNLSDRCDFARARGNRLTRSRLDFDVEVDLGSAARPSPVNVTYFVAVVVPATQEVLNKETFTVTAPFEEGSRSVSIRERIDEVAIPMDRGLNGSNYEIIIGFELTPQQVEFNRTRGY